MRIRPLTAGDAAALQEIRLESLRSEPTAFSSSYEEESQRPNSEIASRPFKNPLGRSFGAFVDNQLVGIARVEREERRKLSHKAWLCGVYVTPAHRQTGVGRRVVAAALEFAFGKLDVRQVNLGVNTLNEPAIALYRSFGFTPFGLEKCFLCLDGVFYDEMQMVLTSDDWQR